MYNQRKGKEWKEYIPFKIRNQEGKPFKEKNVPPKEKHTFPEGKGRNTSKIKIPPRFVVPHPVPPEQKWHVL